MVKRLNIYALVFIFHLCWLGGLAQGHVFSEVKVNQDAVYVGQPVEVTVSVYTSTWFTKGVQPGNIKVNGAFTIYFRSVSSSERINGKTYAGVNMIFNVFPYDDEDIVFPALEISVETPDEGDSKGIQRIIKTKPRSIRVKPVPASYDRKLWMVSPGVSVSDNWLGNKNAVKVGTVLERKIKREVQNSVAELIPPIIWDSIPGVSLYPSRGEVRNNRTRTAISASRTDGVKYLFETEGEVEIPELVIYWWNPQSSTMQKRTLQKTVIQVASNPELGMLTSIRDSLSTVSAQLEGEEAAEEKIKILGLSIKEFSILVVLLFLISYLLYRVYGPLRRAIKKRRDAYLNSEAFYFKKYQKAARYKDSALAQQSLYRWIDQLHLNEPTLAYFAEKYGSDKLQQKILDTKGWSVARRNYLNGNITTETKKENWINP